MKSSSHSWKMSFMKVQNVVGALVVATLPLESGRMTLTLLTWGLGSPLGLPKLQSLIVGGQTPCIEVFFISLESYQSVDVENGLARAIWTSIAQVMVKRKATTKSWESTQPR
jgi:hypothetical protein